MKLVQGRVVVRRRLGGDIYLLGLKSSYLSSRTQPGQFVNVYLQNEGVFLPRPFSIHKIEPGMVYLLVKIKGRATRILTKVNKGDTLHLCGPLGKQFDWRAMAEFKEIVLIGGGIGVAPLVFLAQKLKSVSSLKQAFLGAARKEGLVAKKELQKYGFVVYTATLNGSAGEKGDVVSVFLRHLSQERKEKRDLCVFACGPKGMAKTLQEAGDRYGVGKIWFSFETVIACGLGICRGCAIETRSGHRLLCQDGPVFDLHEITFA